MSNVIRLVPLPDLRLRDGRPVMFQAITPAARPLIEQAIGQVSMESSRRRFFTPRFRFSEREWVELTAMDGHDRYALGAVVAGFDGRPEGVGIARFARVAGRSDTAEVAVLVVDAFHGQGVGRTLLSRLARAAIARGIARFRGMVMTDNDPMLILLRRYAPGLAIARADDHLEVEVPLPRFAAPA